MSKGAAVAIVLSAAGASAQTPSQPPPQAPPATAPQPPPSSQTPATPPAPGTPVAPAGPATTIVPRTFTAPNGFLFNTVRPERVKDFETFLWYLQAALEKSTDAGVQAQARGWRTFKATEPGPNNTVLYVFVFDPAVAEADYGLGRILADAYPDSAQLTEIWRLYQGSITSGGSLLNLTPVKPVAPEPEQLPAPAQDPAAPPQAPAPVPEAPAPVPEAPAPTPQ